MTAVVRFGEAECRPIPIPVDAYLGMAERGELPDLRMELIEGVIIEMSPKGDAHSEAQAKLLRLFNRGLGDDVLVHAEPTLRLADSAPQPDIAILRRGTKPSAVAGADLLLLIEVADSSLSADLGTKARLYALHEAPEYWVVDVVGRTIVRHLEPRSDGYACVDAIPWGESITPSFAPHLTVRLDDLARE